MPDSPLTPRPLEEEWVEETLRGMGLKRLNPAWAKAEILLGLAAAAGGFKLLTENGIPALAGGILIVLGGYLAMAGNRSHIYQSQNRQTAYLRQAVAERGSPQREETSGDG